MRGAGVVAAQAEQWKVAKYAHLDTTHHFVPFVVDTSGVLGEAAVDFTRDLGRHLSKPPESPAAENSSCRESRWQCREATLLQFLGQWGGGWMGGSDFDCSDACIFILIDII